LGGVAHTGIRSVADAKHSTDLGATGDPFGGGNSSIYFDGTGDYLVVEDSDDWNFGAGDFTVQAFIRPSTVVGTKHVVGQWLGIGTNQSWILGLTGAEVSFYYNDGTSKVLTSSGAGVLANTWHHIAAVRNGDTLTIYLDGTSVGSVSVAGSTLQNSTTFLTIGASNTPATVNNTFAGYIDDILVLKGTANAPTSKPTAYASIGSNNLLIQSGSSPNGSKTFFDAEGNHNAGIFGSSAIYFDGTLDALSIPDSADFALGTGPFTFQAFVRPANVTGFKSIFVQATSSNTNFSIAVQMSGAKLRVVGSSDGTTFNVDEASASNVFTENTWHHVAVVRVGDVITGYVDGASVLTINLTASYSFFNSTQVMLIGGESTAIFSGYMEEIAISKGTAEYTGAFTAPTAPFTLVRPNVTFESDAFTASTAPSSSDAYALIQIADGTLATDFTIGVRREGASTYATATITDTGFDFFDIDTSETYDIVKIDDVDLSGQTSGTALQFRLTTANNPVFFFKGWLMQWE
jgi:hypothetical protein